MPIADLMRDNLEVLRTDGSKHLGLKGSVQRDKIFMNAGNKLLVEPGDLIRRKVSTGAEEIYRVIDPGFHEAFHGIPAHYQMIVKRLTAAEAAGAVASLGGEEISEDRRAALFSQWEEYGLDIIKQDLANGGFRFVGGPPSTRKLALQWVRMKESERSAAIPNIHVSGPNSRVNIQSTDQSINHVVSGNVFSEVQEALDRGIKNQDELRQLTDLLSELQAAQDGKTFGARYQAFIASAANHISILAPFLTPLYDQLKSLPT